MSTRSQRLGDELTADLLADLADEERIGSQASLDGAPPATPVTADVSTPQTFVETTVFLSPKAWLRPGLARMDGTVALTAGPLRLSAGRR